MTEGGGRRFAASSAALWLFACATTGSPPEGQTEAPRPLLWEVRSDEGPGTVYLLGSVHVGPRTESRLTPDVAAAVDAASTVVLEARTPGFLESVWLLAQLGTLPDDRRLSEVVAPETWKRLEPRLAQLGLPRFVVERLAPWTVSMLLMATQLDAQGYSDRTGIDRLVQSRAAARDKRLRYMETAESQLRLFADLSLELQERMLSEQLRTDPSESFDDLERAYRNGDLDALQALLVGEFEGYPELKERILDDRNLHFADFTARLLEKPSVSLVVAGAGHMVGPTGLPALLRQRGARVRRLGAGELTGPR